MEALRPHFAARKTLAELPDGDFVRIGNEELLTCGAEILVPAALENTISKSNAGNVRARFIIEGANGPITPAADEILEANGVTVVPDILANAGGVVVSYFEWVQNLQSFRWEEDYVNDMLERTMRHAFDEVWALAAKSAPPAHGRIHVGAQARGGGEEAARHLPINPQDADKAHKPQNCPDIEKISGNFCFRRQPTCRLRSLTIK